LLVAGVVVAGTLNPALEAVLVVIEQPQDLILSLECSIPLQWVPEERVDTQHTLVPVVMMGMTQYFLL
jgi:hypothetical protein